MRIIFLFSLCLSFSAQTRGQNKPPYNVLLIMVDDLNDCLEGMGGHAQAISPNLNGFAQTGASFLRAYTNAPMCGPSRSSLFTGVYPHHSRNFFQAPWYNNKILNNTRTLMEQFQEAGYQVLGTGKILHHNKAELWTEFGNAADYGPSPFDGTERVPHPDVPKPFAEIGWVDGSLGPFKDLSGYTNPQGNPLTWTTGNGRNIPYQVMRYQNDEDRDPTPDEQNANWAATQIQQLSRQTQDQPFFMAVGFLRPHTPLVAPQKYFDKFPLDKLELAVIHKEDENDTHLHASYKGDVFTLTMGKRMYHAIKEAYGSREEGLKRWTQAYLACVAAVDENIGTVLKALDNSPLKENTVVIIASDHGFHMGEKDYLYKNSLWEESTRVPLFMRVPGLTAPGQQIEHPVSLIHLYPTLVDLCGLPSETRKHETGHSLDGVSLLPLLAYNKPTKWEGPKAALTAVFAGSASKSDPAKQHYALRSERYRYIRYSNGMEELYDHKRDPYETRNLANRKKGTVKNLRNMLFRRVPIR